MTRTIYGSWQIMFADDQYNFVKTFPRPLLFRGQLKSKEHDSIINHPNVPLERLHPLYARASSVRSFSGKGGQEADISLHTLNARSDFSVT